MPMTPPPPPLTKQQFDAAIKRGARTLREIDPRLAEYLDKQQRIATVQGVAISIGIVGIVAIATMIVLAT